MKAHPGPMGRRERAKQDKRRRVVAAAAELLGDRSVDHVTMQEVADRADVAIGTLYLYAGTKAELLIMAQNPRFAAAVDDGVAAAGGQDAGGTVESVLALLRPVIASLREQPENGRAYLHELVFGDRAEPHRAEGLALALRLEEAIARILLGECGIAQLLAVTLARVVTAIVLAATMSAQFVREDVSGLLCRMRLQVTAILSSATATDSAEAGHPT